MTMPDAAVARFWSHVDQSNPDECWPWTAGRQSRGYGAFRPLPGVQALAHRIAYTVTHGPIPDGTWIDHTCHNGTDCPGGRDCLHRRCCNPAHLEAVDPVVNAQRSHTANHRKTHCPRGHAYTDENTRHQSAVRPGNRLRRACRQCDRDRDKIRDRTKRKR